MITFNRVFTVSFDFASQEKSSSISFYEVCFWVVFMFPCLLKIRLDSEHQAEIKNGL